MKATLPAQALGTVLLVTLFYPAAWAEPAYQEARLVSIERQSVETPLEWVYDRVATYYETVTYRLTIEVGNKLYVTEYASNVQPEGPLPTEWQAGQPLRVRIEKGRMMIKLSYDGEMAVYIVRRPRP
jgi:hypothetical protein